VPHLAGQAIDQLPAASGKEDGAWAFAAARDAQEGTADGWGDVLGQAPRWQDLAADFPGAAW